MGQRILFLSNGHGEDLNGSLILRALQQAAPELELAALPIVGSGAAYQKLGVPLVGPTQAMPSGGFNYVVLGRLLNPANWRRNLNVGNLIRDLFSGLLTLTWGQIQAVRRYGPSCELLFATGDIVPILFAAITGRPFMVFLVSTSSYYEGRAVVPLLAMQAMRSRRCRQVFTRDAFTAQDLQRRGLSKAVFAGYPIMDVLTPTGQSLGLRPDQPMIALLPGSRLPEAVANLGLQLQLCEAIAQRQPAQFRAALVPSIDDEQLAALAAAQGWQVLAPGHLAKGEAVVICRRDAFSDILHQCALAIGMAGTAVEQAVGLGKPVVQIIGNGPQFTYPFAEAQMRLLGPSVVTIGKRPADAALLGEAAAKITAILQDDAYRQQCQLNGRERVGTAGGAAAIAAAVQQALSELPLTAKPS